MILSLKVNPNEPINACNHMHAAGSGASLPSHFPSPSHEWESRPKKPFIYSTKHPSQPTLHRATNPRKKLIPAANTRNKSIHPFRLYNIHPTLHTMSTPASEAATNPNPTAPTTNIYEYITSYDFASDPEFRRGLGTILGHPGTPASEDELRGGGDVVLQAKCFYISRFV